MLKGAKGTTVHISLGREGWDKPIEVTVMRDEIPRPGVEYFTMVKPGIGYVRVSTFNETTDSDLAEALKQLDVSEARRIDYRPAQQWRRIAEPGRGHGGHVPRQERDCGVASRARFARAAVLRGARAIRVLKCR